MKKKITFRRKRKNIIFVAFWKFIIFAKLHILHIHTRMYTFVYIGSINIMKRYALIFIFMFMLYSSLWAYSRGGGWILKLLLKIPRKGKQALKKRDPPPGANPWIRLCCWCANTYLPRPALPSKLVCKPNARGQTFLL